MDLRILELISHDPEDRDEHEVELVIPYLRKLCDLLNNMSEDVLVDIIINCKHQRSHRDDVIIKQGEKGDCFYILLSGKTSVYIDNQKSEEGITRNDDDDPNVTSRKTDMQKLFDEIDLISGRKSKKEIDANKQFVLDRTQFGKFIMNFDAGKSFGELALMNEDAIRNASIIADEDTDLLVVSRGLFNRCIKARQEHDYMERKDFIMKCPLFDQWSVRNKRLLEMSLRKETYTYDTDIVKQGEPVKGLHFITEGTAKIVLSPALHPTQYPRLFSDENDPLSKELNRSMLKKQEDVKNTINDQIRVRRQHGYAAAEKRLKQKTIDLCCVDKSDVIGDIEMVLPLNTYHHTIVTTSNCEAFILDVKNYERLVPKKNMGFIELLRKQFEQKLKGRIKTPHGAQIKLFQHFLNKIDDLKPKKAAPHLKKQLAQRELHLLNMRKLFLEDRGPMLEPCVPGTIFYKNIARLKSSYHNPWMIQAATIAEAAQKEKPKFTVDIMPKTRIPTSKRRPRSTRELQSLRISAPPKPILVKQRSSRPLTAPGKRVSDAVGTGATTGRPQTALGHKSGNTDDVNELGEPNMHDIVDQIDELQKRKESSRNRILCSMIVDPSKSYESSSGAKARSVSAPAVKNGEVEEATEEPNTTEESEESDNYYDWETSEPALRTLEDRLMQFHKGCNDSPLINKKLQPTMWGLRRFDLKGPEAIPMSGGTVFVKTRLCKYPPGAQIDPEYHKHVRRFIIPKESFSNPQTLTYTKMV
ncbi:unnamed protein product [Owenia fusiformis]|uniref:Cyclic nucleotide-binding domain-containing protein n=1 Tax=Owenia fusiformis TaxID=6347 RepID=A0A8S4PCU2_OWEFU|nr:unnamed protein product [Owenia fusiformis]